MHVHCPILARGSGDCHLPCSRSGRDVGLEGIPGIVIVHTFPQPTPHVIKIAVSTDMRAIHARCLLVLYRRPHFFIDLGGLETLRHEEGVAEGRSCRPEILLRLSYVWVLKVAASDRMQWSRGNHRWLRVRTQHASVHSCLGLPALCNRAVNTAGPLPSIPPQLYFLAYQYFLCKEEPRVNAIFANRGA